MDDIKALLEINWGYVFIALCSALLGFKLIWTAAHWFLFDVLGIETKRMKQRREDHELLIKTSQNLIALQEKHDKDTDTSNKHDNELDEKLTTFMTEVKYEIKNLVNDRIYDSECSREYRAEFNGVQNKIFESLNEMSTKIDDMQKSTDERFEASEEKQNKRVQSEIKERIAQSYRRYNLSKKITKMELEALEDSINTYEEHGGDNSFIHSVVQKEMYSWEVIDK